MASNRAKLSLRRTRKQASHVGASQPVALPTSCDDTAPLPSGGMVSDDGSPASGSVEESGSIISDGGGGGEEPVGEEEDFHPQPLSKSGLGRKRKQLLTSR